MRGLAARRRVAQLQRERSVMRAKKTCVEQVTLEPCTCQGQSAEESNGTADALPARSSCSSEASAPSRGEHAAEPAESTAVAAGGPKCAAVLGLLRHVDSRLLPVLARKEDASAGADFVALGGTRPALAGPVGHGGACDLKHMQQRAAGSTHCQAYERQSPSGHGHQAREARPGTMSHAQAACKAPQGLQHSHWHASCGESAHAVDCCMPSSSQQRVVSVLHASAKAIDMPASTSARCDITHVCSSKTFACCCNWLIS